MESRILRALWLLSFMLIPRGAFVVRASSFDAAGAATAATTTAATSATAAAAAIVAAYFSSPDTSLERKVEEEAGVELPLDVETHRRILATIDPRTVFNPDRPACVGPCPARGGPYTGRGCESYFQCRH
ncbi:uncharacterized protein LOC109725823 [Ananas comosus]|uniref:Uncharacterized protein LOC109725823 n=1 Tax=Ananas comosus TaxID=4615 RepID=A0A6P5GSI9_ANACO|nr:uncharacterized protein LOC109725823 [Ananas comosus]